MKRPLFWVCLCLVVISAVRFLCTAHRPPFRASVTDGQEMVLMGTVCEKQTDKFYISAVGIYDPEANLYSDQATNQKANQETNQKTNQETNQEANQETNQEADSNTITTGLKQWDMLPRKYKVSCAYPDNMDGEDLKMGTTVCLKGTWNFYSNATNPGEFDVKKYYDSLLVLGKMDKPQVLHKSESYYWIGEGLYRLRCHFQNRIKKVFPEKEAGILCTMLLGQKEDLDEEIRSLYQKNGIVHILSVSGLHITLIGMSLYELLRRLGVGIRPATVCGGLLLVAYGIMIGMPISACRAIGMYLFRMLSLWWGRTYDLLTALGVLAVLLLIRNPAYLIHSGFLLSFSSLLGIALVYPILEQYFHVKGKIGKSLLGSSSIFLATLPIQLWFSYEVPLWGILLNLAVIPLSGVLVGTAMFVVLVPGTGFLGTLDCLILKLYEGLCLMPEMVSQNPLADKFPFLTGYWNPGRPKAWQVAVYYGGLGILFWIAKKKSMAFRKVAWSIALAFLLFLSTHSFKGGFQVWFLDVGQGDCIFVETAAGKNYLFDCGSVSRSRVGEKVLLPFLKYRGIHDLDGIFLSHADKDHISGALELLQLASREGIGIKRVGLPDCSDSLQIKEEFEDLWVILEAYGNRKKPEVVTVGAGDCFGDRFSKILCLHPKGNEKVKGVNTKTVEDRKASDNASSECFYLRLRNPVGKECVTLLLTGDVEKEGEKELLEEFEKRDLSSPDLLKVAHHGSKYSSSEELLQVIQPGIATISVGKKNSYGHPHKETLQRLEAAGTVIFRTDKSGAIVVCLRKGRIEINTYCKTETINSSTLMTSFIRPVFTASSASTH